MPKHESVFAVPISGHIVAKIVVPQSYVAAFRKAYPAALAVETAIIADDPIAAVAKMIEDHTPRRVSAA